MAEALDDHDLIVLRRAAASGDQGYQAISDRWVLAILDRLAAAERVAALADQLGLEMQPDLSSALVEWRRAAGRRTPHKETRQPGQLPPDLNSLQTDSFC